MLRARKNNLFYSQLLALSKDLKAPKNWKNTFRNSSPQNSFEVILLCNAMSSHTIPIASCLDPQKAMFFPHEVQICFHYPQNRFDTTVLIKVRVTGNINGTFPRE